MTARAALPADPSFYCFIDTETRSAVDVTTGGAYRHTAEGRVIIVTYAIGDGAVQEWCVRSFADKDRLNWQDAPEDLYRHLLRVRRGDAWFVAWNAGFDRLAMNYGIDVIDPEKLGGAPVIPVEGFLDAMAQAVKSHLPPDLLGASQMNGSPIPKQEGGKDLIRLFSVEGGAATPASHPDEWARFRSYARDDVAALRDIWQTTLPLDAQEWAEYWVNERINDRGLPVDVRFAERAAALAALNRERANTDVAEISRGALHSVMQSSAMLDWVAARVEHLPEALRILTSEIAAGEEDDEHTVKMSLEGPRVEALVAYLERLDAEQGLTDEEFDALLMLEARQNGASATPSKFIKMLPMLHEGRIKGQYVFNGAPATGRFSSRGLQMHNLTRATVTRAGEKFGTRDDELDFIELVAGSEDTEATYRVVRERFGSVGKTLSRAIRPAILAPEGKTLFWSDWSAIEARALPWLANDPAADEVLDVFAETDADPSLPDIYRRQAGAILHKDARAVTKEERQSHGKVPVLSLGFGGGKGALHNMARNYGVSFDDAEAAGIVRGWRDANPWARRYWDASWQAVLAAMEHPGDAFEAGRVTYFYERSYRKGTLFGLLPCGRALLYPSIRWERREVRNRTTGIVETKTQLTYRRGRVRAALWYGTLVENATQGICGSLLRWALVEFERRLPGHLIGHTHDEIVGLAPVGQADAAAAALVEVMRTGPEWAEGLPLNAEAEINEWYTKTGG